MPRLLRAFTAIASLAATVSHPAAMAQASAPLVTTLAGKLEGSESDGIRSFKGIPYAKPPVGELRWRPPVAAQGWSGVREARKFGKACLQPPPNPASLYYGGAASVSEDCLTLNIWAPARARKLPVM